MTMRVNYGVVAPESIKAMMGLEQTVEAMGLDRKLIHLIKLRASQINGCAYCIDMHNREARADGERQQRLDLLSAWRETNFFDDRERAVLGWTEALTLISETNAPDADYEALAAVFDEKERVAVTLAIGAINAWNRFAIGFRTPVPRVKE
jgi:AhpD family alkylhydroperoxidase